MNSNSVGDQVYQFAVRVTHPSEDEYERYHSIIKNKGFYKKLAINLLMFCPSESFLSIKNLPKYVGRCALFSL